MEGLRRHFELHCSPEKNKLLTAASTTHWDAFAALE